ncbi:MAG TPA: hypothetical protein PKM59_08410 [Thermodesulfobacteriota bacterium]|nr:hypothetical protein [Thermodesulfobacteriota bacterium]
MSQEIVQTLREVDRFHKCCALLFEDLVASVKEKTKLNEQMANRLGPPDEALQMWESKDSWHLRRYIFEHDEKPFFAFMLVKTPDKQLVEGRSPKFKAVCRHLDVDISFPLLLITGVFEPKDKIAFRTCDNNQKRNWIGHTLLLNVPEGIYHIDPSSYRFESQITIERLENAGPGYCEKATFLISRLLDIKDNTRVNEIVEIMLQL